MSRQHFMSRAVELARNNVLSGGEPFGSVIVKDGKIIGEGVNRVSAEHDPTAHAEIAAIREACKQLGTTDLSDCEIYASGEPCPMCLSTMYWANIKTAYIAYTADDAAEFGLSSAYYYEQLALPKTERAIQYEQIKPSDKNEHPYRLWQEKTR